MPDLTMICFHRLVLNCICTALFVSFSFEQDADDGIEVRLFGGSLSDPNVQWKGNVEIKWNDIWDNGWRTVCTDGFDINDAHVICRQLGYEGAVTVSIYNHEDLESYQLWPWVVIVDELDCDGRENNLAYCPGSFGGTGCSNPWRDAVEVECDETPLNNVAPANQPTYVNVRLSGGNEPRLGVVEVSYKGNWSVICDYRHWVQEDGDVVCRQLGYPAARRVTTLSTLMWNKKMQTPRGRTPLGRLPYNILESYKKKRVLNDRVSCLGTEEHLAECDMKPFGNNIIRRCDAQTSVMVECKPEDPLPIRLIGPYPNEGRVEIYLNQEWGTICDHHWDFYDGKVVCRQLGFPDVTTVDSAVIDFKEGTGPIHLDYVRCDGTEESVAFCEHRGIGVNNCNHKEDVGVLCTSSDSYPNDSAGEDSDLGFTLLAIGLVLGMAVFFCLFLCKIFRSSARNAIEERSTTTMVPQANNPHTAASENRQPSYRPDRNDVLGASAPVAEPMLHCPDEHLMVALPTEQVTTESPLVHSTPPPEYIPDVVVFNANSNSVTMATGLYTTQAIDFCSETSTESSTNI